MSVVALALMAGLLSARVHAFQETVRRPVPPASERDRALDKIRRSFKVDYSKEGKAARRVLAQKLLKEAQQAPSQAGTTFVLLSESIRIASEIGDVSLSFHAIDTLDRQYNLRPHSEVQSPTKMKLEVLSRAAEIADGRAAIVSVANGYISVAWHGARNGNFEVCKSAVKRAVSFGKMVRDRRVLQDASGLSRGITELQTEYDLAWDVDLSKAIDKGDREFNLVVGRFVCFSRGSWAIGLQYLQNVEDEALAKVAQQDAANPKGSRSQVALGDAWKLLADKEAIYVHRKRYQSRARYWYQKALVEAEDDLRIGIDKRLQELGVAFW